MGQFGLHLPFRINLENKVRQNEILMSKYQFSNFNSDVFFFILLVEHMS